MTIRLKIPFHLWNKVIIFSLWKLLWEEGAIILLPPDILRNQRWMFLSGWYLTQTKITQDPNSFTQWCFIILLSLNLLYVTRLQLFSMCGWIWLNSFCQSLLKFSSSLPVSVWAAIIRCQRLGKLGHNRSLLFMVLGAWSSRWGHQHGRVLRKALVQFAQGPCTFCPHVEEQARELSGFPYRGSDPTHGGPVPSWPNHLLKASPPNTIT